MRGGPQRAAPKKADPGRYRSKPNSNTPDDRRGRPAPGRGPGPQDRNRDNRGKDRKKVGCSHCGYLFQFMIKQACACWGIVII